MKVILVWVGVCSTRIYMHFPSFLLAGLSVCLSSPFSLFRLDVMTLPLHSGAYLRCCLVMLGLVSVFG